MVDAIIMEKETFERNYISKEKVETAFRKFVMTMPNCGSMAEGLILMEAIGEFRKDVGLPIPDSDAQKSES